MKKISLICAVLALTASPSTSSEIQVDEAQASTLFVGQAYSPYVNRAFPGKPKTKIGVPVVAAVGIFRTVNTQCQCPLPIERTQMGDIAEIDKKYRIPVWLETCYHRPVVLKKLFVAVQRLGNLPAFDHCQLCDLGWFVVELGGRRVWLGYGLNSAQIVDDALGLSAGGIFAKRIPASSNQQHNRYSHSRD